MRKLMTAALALVSALAFLVVGSPSASAFGSEVLGCNAGLGWTANSCHDIQTIPAGHLIGITFSPAGTSGTYDTTWTVTTDTGAAIYPCQANYVRTPCITAGTGCTAGSMDCQVTARAKPDVVQVITATLTLTQSGQTRTVTAQATIWDGLY